MLIDFIKKLIDFLKIISLFLICNIIGRFLYDLIKNCL